MKTTELQELLSVAEKSIIVRDRLQFNEAFNPTTCAELVWELMRLRGVDSELDDIRECSKCDLCEDHY
jgi:hypothetical protein